MMFLFIALVAGQLFDKCANERVQVILDGDGEREEWHLKMQVGEGSVGVIVEGEEILRVGSSVLEVKQNEIISFESDEFEFWLRQSEGQLIVEKV